MWWIVFGCIIISVGLLAATENVASNHPVSRRGTKLVFLGIAMISCLYALYTLVVDGGLPLY